MVRQHPDFAFPGKPPTGPIAVDWSNHITEGLLEVYVGFSNVNLVDGRDDVNTPGVNWKPGIDRTTYGEADNGRTLPRSDFTDYPIANGNQFSILYFGMYSLNGAAVSMRRGAGGGTYEVSFGTGANNVGFSFLGATYNAGLGANEHARIILAHDGPNAEDNRATVNGGFVTFSGATAEDFNSAGPFRWNDSVNGFKECSNGGANLRAVWNRALSNEELLALDLDPYQIFRPAIETPLIAPAGGIVAQLNAGAISLAGASILGRITAALAAGGYSLSGGDMAMLRQALLSGGAVSLSGADATGNRTSALGAGGVSLAGGDIVGRIEAALASGSIALSGGDLALSIVRALFAGNISQADLVSDGRNSLTLVDDGQNEAGSS